MPVLQPSFHSCHAVSSLWFLPRRFPFLEPRAVPRASLDWPYHSSALEVKFLKPSDFGKFNVYRAGVTQVYNRSDLFFFQWRPRKYDLP